MQEEICSLLVFMLMTSSLLERMKKRIEEIKYALLQRFDIKDMGKLHHFLGMKILQDESSERIWIGQPAYISKILQKFGIKIASQLARLLILGQSLRNLPTVKIALINNVINLQLELCFTYR